MINDPTMMNKKRVEVATKDTTMMSPKARHLLLHKTTLSILSFSLQSTIRTIVSRQFEDCRISHKMPVPSLKTVFKTGRMTRNELIKISKGMDTALNCVSHFEGLQDKGGYGFGQQFPYELYKNGLQQRLVAMCMAHTPGVHVLDYVGYDYSAAYVGREFARFLRVRNQESAVVLRVYVKDRRAAPKMILLQLIGSLIWNMISLVPSEFDGSEYLRSRLFEELMNCGPNSFDAGLRILEALPLLELSGKKMVCIVDGLDLAEEARTLGQLQSLLAVFRGVIAKNRGNILYTINRRSRIIR
ncbi:uncharacterized protein F4822DRAFT_407788 [Hypoxylon trugodes]|uniref:uncharacterized protein n=1 Tax=Hypoxylon trugodes TaxID=326681 RepID=UPI00218DF852|nr:uncharacterized protein F4822DRAFT_407788 [Hypoxylon trugodes]KAI1387849.1 hypothetical protein F4822DRAFT_407788 [Hypoxylon trugodes]